MKSNTSRCMILMTLGSIVATVLIGAAVERQSCIDGQISTRRIHRDMDARAKSEPIRAHRKLKPPADIYMEVTDAGDRQGPVSVTIYASSLIPVQSGAITITTPALGDTAGQTELVWSNTDPGFVAEAAAYTTGPLPEGLHQFIAAFEFVPDHPNAETMIVADSLYLDVRSDAVLSSNVSFDHIKRIELLQELEQRASLEARSPGITANTIAQIKTTDPDMTHRIEELNRIEGESDTSANELERSPSPARGGPPAHEVVVPARRKSAQ